MKEKKTMSWEEIQAVVPDSWAPQDMTLLNFLSAFFPDRELASWNYSLSISESLFTLEVDLIELEHQE